MSEQVVFYSWIENVPSSLTIRVSGGEMSHNGEDAKLQIVRPLKEVRFNRGLLRVPAEDLETINLLRKMITQGETITEDHELYLSKILSVKEQSTRNAKKAVDAMAEATKLREENEELRRKLAKRSGKLGQADDAAAPAA